LLVYPTQPADVKAAQCGKERMRSVAMSFALIESRASKTVAA